MSDKADEVRNVVQLQKLTREAFSPFGSVIEVPRASKEGQYPEGKSANQGSAMKYPDIAPFSETYSNKYGPGSCRGMTSLFNCFPRKSIQHSDQGNVIGLSVLERHPYTTQTFVPMGLSEGDKDTTFLVVVASSKESGPNMQDIHAFVARGNQAVTYGVGAWHAPMIVLGENPIPFAVTQYSNGRPSDDCEEVPLEGVWIRLDGDAFVNHRL